jgi:uncharacterized protein YdaU (DUF1376 family)
MPVYIGDYLADTMHLSTEQHGAYLLLLFHLWRRGSLQDDDVVLAQITGLPIGTWNVCRAVLAEFFEIHDGAWHHRRVERERIKVSAKQQYNANRAKLGAHSRWSKAAPSSAMNDADDCVSNASSIREVMLGDAKSQSQPELLKAFPSSRGIGEKRAPDERHVPFRLILAEYWRAKNQAFPEMPWQGRDAKALSDFLAASPNLDETQFRKMLENRAKSAVAHGDRIFLWIANQTLTMNYMEGLSGPIHFSQYAGREVAMGAARKWSLDDIAGSVAVRCERQLAENASPFGALRQSQVLIGSSAPDGTVQMIATGVYNDNGSGIACQYETTSTQDLMDVSILGGVSINALGQGSMTVSVMVARTYADSPQSPASNGTNEIKLAPFPLTPENWRGYDGGARGQNERFRMRFTNGSVANAWFALKYCSLFTRPLFTGRSSNGA